VSKLDRIIYYLATGMQHNKIADIVDCTPSYVSQCLADPDNADQIARMSKELKRSEQEEAIEEEYIKLEESVVAQVKQNLPFAEFNDLTRLMDSLIKRKQSTNPLGIVSNVQNNNHITILQVPKSVLPGEIVLNPQSELIAVGDKSLAPMTTFSVKKLFEGLRKKKLDDFPDVDVTTLKSMPDDF
jgi:predicted transcriptional regulator